MAWLPRGAVSALLLLCAGCSSLIGLDEFSDAPADTAGAGGTSGEGGSGAGGSGAQGGTGAQGGSAAQGGTGNASGNGGSGGVVTACSGQPDGQTCTLEGADAGTLDAGATDAGTDGGGLDGGAAERRICLNQQCVVSRCGDGYADEERGEACDDKKNGNPSDGCRDDCQYTCTTNDDCVAGLQCVLSQCNQTTHTCGPQTADTCDDGDACTADSCNSTSGACVNSFIDEDGDGFSGRTCKADGAHSDKGGDCVDSSSVTGSASVYPGETTFYATPHNIPGQKPFDYNCDGVEEQRFQVAYSNQDGQCHDGWDMLALEDPPACGVTAAWKCYRSLPSGNSCVEYAPALGCTPMRTQECR